MVYKKEQRARTFLKNYEEQGLAYYLSIHTV